MLSSKAKMFSNELTFKGKSDSKSDNNKKMWLIGGATLLSILGLGYFSTRNIRKSDEYIRTGIKNTKQGIDKIIEDFHNEGILTSPADIFTLEQRNSGDDLFSHASGLHLETREGWGKKSVDNLFKAIRDRRVISLPRFIYALGIRQVGTATARLIAKHYGDFSSFMNDMKTKETGKLVAIDGIGAAMATDMVEFFQEAHNLAIIDKLLKYVTVEPFVDTARQDSKLSGKTVVFTGTLSRLTRAEAKAKALEAGAKVSGSVSKNTDYVVLGTDAGSKEKTAKELGIALLSEDDFIAFLK